MAGDRTSLTLLPSGAQTGSNTALVSTSGKLDGASAIGFPGGGPTLGRYRRGMVLLDVTAAGSLAGDTLDVYLQKQVGPRGSAVWTDFVHYTQVLGNGGAKQFVAELNNDGSAPTSAIHAVQDGALAAGTVNQGPWSDDWRIKWVIVNGTGTHTFTFSLTGHFWE